jgi:hypothetical protein
MVLVTGFADVTLKESGGVTVHVHAPAFANRRALPVPSVKAV